MQIEINIVTVRFDRIRRQVIEDPTAIPLIRVRATRGERFRVWNVLCPGSVDSTTRLSYGQLIALGSGVHRI